MLPPARFRTTKAPSGHAGRLPSRRVFLAGEEPAFNILFVGHPTPANLSERLARTGHSGDRAPPTVTITCRGPVESISLRPPKGWRLVHLHLARPSRFVVNELFKGERESHRLGRAPPVVEL